MRIDRRARGSVTAVWTGAFTVLVGIAGGGLSGCGQAGSGSGELPAKDMASATSGGASSSAVSASPGGSAAPGATGAPGAPGSSAAASAATGSGAATDSPGGVAAAASGVAPATSRPGAGSEPATSGAAASSAGAAAASSSAAASSAAASSASASAGAVASAAPTAEPLTVQSPKTQEAAFSVWMSSAKTYKVGQAGSVEVVLVPRGDYHCNEAYPYKVKLGAAPAGITYGADVVRGATVSASRASLRVPFTATAAGDARISGKFHFSVCTADQCVIDAREVATTVKVE